MTRQFSKLIASGCLALLFAAPLIAIYLLFNIELFANIAKSSLKIPIQWQTVSDFQWYALWFITFLYVAIGLAGLTFLRRAFTNFTNGELFNLNNSRNLRKFSIFLFAQAIAKPLHFMLSSLLLSMNHPAGQKMLSVSLGSGEVSLIALAIIFWVLSSLLVEASKLENENKQFV